MICPACNESMIILEFNEVEIDYCTSCKGVWLDRGELELIAGEGNASWDVPAEQKTSRRCPRCNRKMREGKFPGTDIELDVCRNGHGLWFDHGELADVLKAQGAEGAAARLHEYFGSVFGNDKEDD